MKNSNDTIWDRTSDLPICSAAPSPLCNRGPPKYIKYGRVIWYKVSYVSEEDGLQLSYTRWRQRVRMKVGNIFRAEQGMS